MAATGVAEASGSTELTVETTDSWSTGTYRWVYLGGGRDSTDVYTDTGTVTVTNTPGGGDDPDTDPDPDPGGDDDDDDNDNTGGTGGAPPADTGPEPVTETVDIGADGSAQVQLSGDFDTTSVTVNVPGATGQVEVKELSEPPADAPAPTGQFVSGVDISAPNPSEGETATVTVGVSQSRLDELDVSAEELVIQHYRDGAWETLDTSAETQDGEVILSAETTGFSPFAVTTQEQAQVTTTTPTTTTQPDDTTDTPTTEPGTETPGPGSGDGFPTTWLIVVLVVIIVAAAVLYTQYDGGNGGSGL